MAHEPLPAELTRFLARHIHTVEQLEILLVLNDRPLRPWTIREIFHKIQSNEFSIAKCLDQFSQNGLTMTDGAGHYRLPENDGPLLDMASLLQNTYRDRRVSLISAIYSKTIDPIQAFADAFKLRKDK